MANRKPQLIPKDEYLGVDSNLSSPSSAVTSNYSLVDNPRFPQSSESPVFSSLLRSALPPADEWSGTTNTLPHEALPSSSESGHLWQGQEGDYRHEKRGRFEQEKAGLSFEQEQRLRLAALQRQPQQQFGTAPVFNMSEENFRKIQAMQRQGNALENQRLINMNALYTSRQAPSGMGGFQYFGDQKPRQVMSDGNLVRQYGIQQSPLLVDSNQPQQHSSLLQHQLSGQHVPVVNPPVLQTQYQQALQQQTRMRAELAQSRCSQILTLYLQEQRQKPGDNSVQYWRKLFQMCFAEKATQRSCLSCYGSSPVGRYAQALFPMDNWKCNICGSEPGRGFDANVDVLPTLFKIKYDSGLLEELFFLELPDERYFLPSGNLVFEYSRAVHESSFPEIRIIRYGRLRVTFNNSFKICGWEFCTKSHEEVVPRRNLIQQVHKLSTLVQEVEKEDMDTNVDGLKRYCDAFNMAAKQLAVKLDAPSVNDLGYSKRYVRCLQIAEVVSSMEDIMKFSKQTGLGPIESLAKFPNPRKRQYEDSSAQSTITYVPSNPVYHQQIPENTNNVQTIPYSQLPQEIRAQLMHQQVYGATQQQHVLSRGDSVNHLRMRMSGPHVQAIAMSQQNQQQVKALGAGQRSVQSGQQSLPGTPQSEMSDLRSSAS